jgi:flagellar secretion chaperone FliS
MNYHDSSGQSYLEAAVRTAPPARLRLMLIERGAELCKGISERWKASRPTSGYDEQTLHLSDILTELLSGVGRSDLPLAKQVSDIYVFLIQHLAKAETAGDAAMIDEIRRVLDTEAETWRSVCTGAGEQEPGQRAIAAPLADLGPLAATDRIALAGSLNLQG